MQGLLLVGTVWKFKMNLLLPLICLVGVTCVLGAPTAEEQDAENCMLQWLKSIGIDQASAESYVTLFQDESIDDLVLGQLSLEQLEELGVSKLGHRVLIHNCALGVGDCEPSVCQNAGSCRYSTTFQCVCLNGFSGTCCEQVVDWCAAYPCLNGGTCQREQDGAGSCDCPVGYTGERCQADHCHTNPCQNGGICTSHSDNYTCSCPSGYEGRNCETEWFDRDEYLSLTYQVLSLSTQIEDLSQDVEGQEALLSETVIDVLDTVLSTQGPRFFKQFQEIEHDSISQVRTFNIDDRKYIGAVNTNSRHEHYGIIIYELSDDTLTHVQTIETESPISFKPFTIGADHYIASANFFDSQSRSVTSKLYKWDGSEFIKVQEFATSGAKDVDFITMSLGRFLVFSCYHNTRTHATPSLVYVWNVVINRFVFYQALATTGAQKVHFFTSQSQTFLSVACEYDGNRNGNISSTVFRWNGTYFDLYQNIPTHQAHDLYPVVVGSGCHTFLVAANFFDYISHNINSKVYRLEAGGFVEHFALPTKGAVAVESFVIRSEHFVAIANSHDEDTGSSNTISTIYKIDGPNFVPFQEIPTRKASFIHSFNLKDGCVAMAVANEAGRAKLYKWTRVSLRSNPCCV